ncbi:MAG: EAL domain-containing protein, partial [Gammaproteobacteria bacterium]|nr:EAL domain-containing protein [Gammaproteobacteria bacterium]
KTADNEETGSQPSQAPAAEVSSTAQEINLDIESLDDNSKALFSSFEEKRIILSYQPIISLLNEEVESEDEIHAVGLLQADDMASVNEEDLRDKVTSKEFKMYIDRWILRDVIGNLSIKDSIKDSFIINISDASLADASFFNWFRKILTGLDSKNLGKYIMLEINNDHLATLEKQAGALISYLRKTHDFSFVLGNVKNIDEIITFTNKFQFDVIRCNSNIIKELQEVSAPDDEVAKNGENATQSQLDLLKSKQVSFIADDISDATTLTDTISIGTEYAMGEFIGEPVTQLDDMTNIESFEIV